MESGRCLSAGVETLNQRRETQNNSGQKQPKAAKSRVRWLLLRLWEAPRRPRRPRRPRPAPLFCLHLCGSDAIRERQAELLRALSDQPARPSVLSLFGAVILLTCVKCWLANSEWTQQKKRGGKNPPRLR